MYSDDDGIATKQSQAVYNTRIRILLYTTSLLSWLGFGLAVLNGDYAGDFSLLLSGFLGWSKFLWVSCALKSAILCVIDIDLMLSLYFHSIVLALIGQKALSTSIPPG